MPLFKKEVKDPNEVLAEVVSEIIRSAHITIGDLVSSAIQEKLGVPVPLPASVKELEIEKPIALLIAKRIDSEAALEALKRIKKILSQYKL